MTAEIRLLTCDGMWVNHFIPQTQEDEMYFGLLKQEVAYSTVMRR
jgi:hypothetical protein